MSTFKGSTYCKPIADLVTFYLSTSTHVHPLPIPLPALGQEKPGERLEEKVEESHEEMLEEMLEEILGERLEEKVGGRHEETAGRCFLSLLQVVARALPEAEQDGEF